MAGYGRDLPGASRGKQICFTLGMLPLRVMGGEDTRMSTLGRQLDVAEWVLKQGCTLVP